MNRCSLLLGCLLCAVALPDSGAEIDAAGAQQHLREAAGAREAGDYAAYTRALEAALELNPGSYYTRYAMARGYARIGRPDEALAVLERLAAARVDFGVAEDESFTALRELPRFQALLATLAEATRPISRGRHRYTFDRLGLIPEGIAGHPASGRLFFGSMRTGEVFVVDSHGQLAKFAEVTHRDRPLSAIGMTVDAARGLLWVVGTSFFLTEGYREDEPVHSGVFGFDLTSGDLERKILGQDVGHGYNDVTLGTGGELYLSGAVIGRVAPDGEAIEPVATDRAIFGSNGIVATPDGRHLITSSYPVGIAVIDLADGTTRYLESPEHVPLYGIDGMYLHRGDLIAVQNGLEPWRLVRLKLDPELRAVTAAVYLEFANPEMTATTGVIVGKELHFIGQAPAPEHPPAHFEEALAPNLGRTVIMTAPLE